MSDLSPEVERLLTLVRLRCAVDEDEVVVMRAIQRAVDLDIYTNGPGAQLYGSAVLKALREMGQHILRSVLWPGSES